MAIYFLRCAETGFTKIGYSKDVTARVQALRCSTPTDLELQLVIPGTMAMEKALHEYMAPEHHKGEWFRLTDEDLIRAAVFGLSCLMAEVRGKDSFVQAIQAEAERRAINRMILNEVERRRDGKANEVHG